MDAYLDQMESAENPVFTPDPEVSTVLEPHGTFLPIESSPSADTLNSFSGLTDITITTATTDGDADTTSGVGLDTVSTSTATATPTPSMDGRGSYTDLELEYSSDSSNDGSPE